MVLEQYEKCEDCPNYSKIYFLNKSIFTCLVNGTENNCILLKGRNENVKCK